MYSLFNRMFVLPLRLTMSSDGSDQYHPVYLDTTPEILRSLGLIRLVNGKMPKRLAAPPPVVRSKFIIDFISHIKLI